MRKVLGMLLVLSAASPTIAGEPQQMVAPVRLQHSGQVQQKAMLAPSLRNWVSAQARATLESGLPPDPEVIENASRARLAGQDFSNADIAAIVQLVMQECARQAEADLKDVMEQMRAANERKAAMRESANAQREAATKARESTRVQAEKPDSLSDQGEMTSLRLQMVMDRRAKAFEALSNLMKKNSDTSSAIISNLK